jgi:hypothetical protein
MSEINIIVASSNIVGVYGLIKYSIFSKPWYIVFSAMLASFLMHISETKHNLPGVLFVKYSYLLLWLDRIVAISTSLYVIPVLTKNSYVGPNRIIF